MGNPEIVAAFGPEDSQQFTRAIITDLLALDQMIKSEKFETGVRRIGAEQELAIVNNEYRPAPVGQEILTAINESRITTELARFNLEINASPRLLREDCFSQMQTELQELINLTRKTAQNSNADVVLTGILPTLRRSDLTLNNMTDKPRYTQLNRALIQLRGGEFHIHIKGIDEILVIHESMMLESCNTSFQIHYQVEPGNFATIYNLAQAVSAPLLACAVNSPLLFNKRLWNETRIALFQHSIDERNIVLQERFRPPRANFGDSWVRGSVLEIYQENVSRYRNLLTTITENSQELLAHGEIPELKALCLHNGTVWRWNRPCYGIMDGKPHLRIENRILASGPTLTDEIANTAFFAGMLSGMERELPPISMIMSFDDAKENFFAAARHGLNAQFNWIAGKSIPARELILNELLPLAHSGLKLCGVRDEDRVHYLEVVEERVRSGKTGARWILDSFGSLRKDVLPDACASILTKQMIENEKSNRPVHEWNAISDYDHRNSYDNFKVVGQFMSTDLFTVRPDDLVDLAICIMEWQHVRHVPVEDNEGRLVGLISQRDLLHHHSHLRQAGRVPVCAIMKPSPHTVTPDTPTLEAMDFMRKQKVGCLPVVEKERLVGIITTYDLLGISYKLLEERLLEPEEIRIKNKKSNLLPQKGLQKEEHHANL